MSIDKHHGKWTIEDIVKIYNSNMDETIPMVELNKKYIYISYLFNNFGYEFVDAIVEICVLYKLKNAYAFFKKIAEDHIKSGDTTRELIKSRFQRRQPSNLNGTNQYNEDFDSLERKLLGWD